MRVRPDGTRRGETMLMPGASKKLIVVGAGHAGTELAFRARAGKADGKVARAGWQRPLEGKELFSTLGVASGRQPKRPETGPSGPVGTPESRENPEEIARRASPEVLPQTISLAARRTAANCDTQPFRMQPCKFWSKTKSFSMSALEESFRSLCKTHFDSNLIRYAHHKINPRRSTCSLSRSCFRSASEHRAAAHWALYDALAAIGAEPVHARVVTDCNRISGGGVTAGIDFGVTLLAQLVGEVPAKVQQLLLEYDPEPSFACSTSAVAEPELTAAAKSVIGAMGAETLQIGEASRRARALAASCGPSARLRTGR